MAQITASVNDEVWKNFREMAKIKFGQHKSANDLLSHPKGWSFL